MAVILNLCDNTDLSWHKRYSVKNNLANTGEAVIRQSRGRGAGGPSGAAAGWGGWIRRGWAGAVCSPRRAPGSQRRPWRGRCSSAPGPRGRGATWDLWRRWLRPRCRGSLSQEGLEPADGTRCPLRKGGIIVTVDVRLSGPQTNCNMTKSNTDK